MLCSAFDWSVMSYLLSMGFSLARSLAAIVPSSSLIVWKNDSLGCGMNSSGSLQNDIGFISMSFLCSFAKSS